MSRIGFLVRMTVEEKAEVSGAAGKAEVAVEKWARTVLLEAARGGVEVAGPAGVRRSITQRVVGAGVVRGVGVTEHADRKTRTPAPDAGWLEETAGARRCSRHTTVGCARCPDGPWRP
jgi:hypothetical protein